jgi:hypothetical protein
MTPGKVDLDALMQFNDDEKGESSQSNYTTYPFLRISQQSPPPDQEKEFTIRVLPPYSEDNPLPYHKERQHYFSVNGERMSGAIETESPAANLFFKIAATREYKEFVKEGSNKALVASVRRLRPKEKYYYNIVDREDGGVKILSIPPSAHKMIMGCLTTLAKYGQDGTDPETGRDIVLKITGNVDVGYGSYTYTSANIAPMETPVDVPGWEGMLSNLEEAARNFTLSEEQLTDVIPDVLGDHYDAVMELVNNERAE